MTQLQLAIATANYLKKQRLEGFKLTLDPTPKRGGRRSKRGDTWIEIREAADVALSGAKTAGELIEDFYRLAPEVRAWTTNGPRYKAVLTDSFGDEVKADERLEALRRREADRLRDDRDDAAAVLEKALSACERLLEPGDVKQLVTAMIKARY